MDKKIREAIEGIHSSPTMAVIAAAGGGAQALSWLLQVPGASRTILEVTIPYAGKALDEYIAFSPRQVVSEEVATSMARRALERASRLSCGVPAVGIGATATIRTDREKRGEHRCFVASGSPEGRRGYAVKFVKGLRDRTAEDEVVSRLIVRLLAEASGVRFDADIGLQPHERLESLRGEPRGPVSELLAGTAAYVVVGKDGAAAAGTPTREALLSGSFDPLHDGHLKLAKAASDILGVEAAFELSVLNVDKPPLAEGEVRRRLRQFQGKAEVVLTRAPTFVEKARLLQGVTFVIGWDTAVRLFEPKYYDGSVKAMRDALQEIRRLGCRFLVAGRLEAGRFRSLDDLDVPPAFEDMLTPIPEYKFRFDVSSSELRAAAAP